MISEHLVLSETYMESFGHTKWSLIFGPVKKKNPCLALTGVALSVVCCSAGFPVRAHAWIWDQSPVRAAMRDNQ